MIIVLSEFDYLNYRGGFENQRDIEMIFQDFSRSCNICLQLR